MKSRFKCITAIFLSIMLILHPFLYTSNVSKTLNQDMKKYITDLTLLKNHMYTLSQTVVFSWNEDDSAEKIRALERYFNFLVYATNSISFFDNLQSIS